MNQAQQEIYADFKNKYIPPVSLGCSKFERNAILILEKALEYEFNVEGFKPPFSSGSDIWDSIDFYEGHLNVISKKFGISENDFLIYRTLQSNVILYTIFSVIHHLLKSQNEIKKRIEKIEKAAQDLNDLLELDITNGIIAAGLFVSDISKVEDYRKKLKPKETIVDHFNVFKVVKIKPQLSPLLELHTIFKNSYIGESIQFGKSGPKENHAVVLYIQQMANFWQHNLGRSISHSKSDYDGRENFLKFLESCFEFTHPTLTQDTDMLRNAFEKLRSKGKFDPNLQAAEEL